MTSNGLFDAATGNHGGVHLLSFARLNAIYLGGAGYVSWTNPVCAGAAPPAGTTHPAPSGRFERSVASPVLVALGVGHVDCQPVGQFVRVRDRALPKAHVFADLAAVVLERPPGPRRYDTAELTRSDIAR